MCVGDLTCLRARRTAPGGRLKKLDIGSRQTLFILLRERGNARASFVLSSARDVAIRDGR